MTISAAASRKFPDLAALAQRFPLTWSAYVRLLSVKSPAACSFSKTEGLRGGWSVRQLDRQVNSQFYERIRCCPTTPAFLAVDFDEAEWKEDGDAVAVAPGRDQPFGRKLRSRHR